MNSQFYKWPISLIVFFCLTFVAASAVAKKGGNGNGKPDPNPDPDPGISGAACVESGSYFPAFVYTITYQGDPVQSEILLSNAAGDCAIPLYKADRGIGGNPNHLSYRLYGDSANGTGLIVWNEQHSVLPTKIQMLSFAINEGAIVESLPISPTLLLQAEYSRSVENLYAPDLAPAGDRVVFAGYENNDLNYFIDEIRIDAGCWLCRSRIFATQPDVNGDNVSVYQPLYSLDQQRIYFEFDYPERKLAFMDKDESGWSDPVVLLAHGDGDLGVGSVGYWDYDGDGFAQEVIAHPRRLLGYDTIEILDVEACLATTPPAGSACAVVGSRSAGGTVIEGFAPSFTSFSGEPPELLYLFEVKQGPTVLEFNLSDFSERTVIGALKGRKQWVWGVDAAD